MSENIFDYKPIHEWNGSIINFGLPSPSANLELTEIVVGSSSAAQATNQVDITNYSVDTYDEINRIIRLFFSNKPFDIEMFEYSFTQDLENISGFAGGAMGNKISSQMVVNTKRAMVFGATVPDQSYMLKQIWPPKDTSTVTGIEGNGEPYVELGWSYILDIRCSNPQWDNEIDCERPAYCDYTIHTDEQSCIADYCSDLQWWNRTLCLAAGQCSYPTWNNNQSGCLEQRCSNLAYLSSYVCTHAGECDDPYYGSSETNCEQLRCDDTSHATSSKCLGEGTCTNSSYDDYEWGCIQPRCSNTRYGTSTKCLKYGTCSGNSSYNNNKSSCLANHCTDDTWHNNQSGCLGEGTCSNTSYNNNESGCTQSRCTNTSVGDYSTCLSYGTCSDPAFNNQPSNCVNDFNCSNSGYSTQSACLSIGQCTNSAYQNNPGGCLNNGMCHRRRRVGLGWWSSYSSVGYMSEASCNNQGDDWYEQSYWVRNGFNVSYQWLHAGNTFSNAYAWQQLYSWTSAGNEWKVIYSWNSAHTWQRQHTWYSAGNTWQRQHTWTPYNYTWQTQYSWASDNNNYRQQYDWHTNWGHWIPSADSVDQFSNYVVHEAKDTWTAPKVINETVPTTNTNHRIGYLDGVSNDVSQLEIPLDPYCSNPSYSNYSECQTPNGSWIESFVCSTGGFNSQYSCESPRGTWVILYECSNSTYLTDQDGCESPRGNWYVSSSDPDSGNTYSCSNGSYTSESSCTAPNGTWDDVSYCTNSSFSDESSCATPNGTWDDVSYCTTAGFNTRTECLSNRGSWLYSEQIYNTRATKVLYVSGKLTTPNGEHISDVHLDKYKIVQMPRHGDTNNRDKVLSVSAFINYNDKSGCRWKPPEYWRSNINARNNGVPIKYRIYRSNYWHYGVTSPSDFTQDIKKLVGEVAHTNDYDFHEFFEDEGKLRAEGLLSYQRFYYYITAVYSDEIEGEFNDGDFYGYFQ